MRVSRFLSVTTLVVTVALGASVLVAPADAARQRTDTSADGRPAGPGAPGIGDPYFPLDGNGGYDVDHYDLAVRYDPATGLLTGLARIEARATSMMTRFDLDLVGLRVREVQVDGAPAAWSRDGQELQVTPSRGLRYGERFTVRVRYDGVPRRTEGAGFIATDDGFDIAGEPHVAASWFPVDDHPADKATYTFRVTVPDDRKVIANGRLVDRQPRAGWTTWTYDMAQPMASYLATVDVGRWRMTTYTANGLRVHDAVDPSVVRSIATPTTGTRFAVSGVADSAYKRLTHRIAVPAGGASVGFTVTRDTEPDWDFAFVEVHTVGQDDWTTLPDVNGHTSQETGFSCRSWPDLHPFISSHYQTVRRTSCSPTGATGEWWAASGSSAGPEQWQVDLGAYAGSTVELSISYVTDEFFSMAGVFVDDVVVSTGAGTTSFESGRDGWTPSGPPAGSPGNADDWTVGTAEDAISNVGRVVSESFAREPEIIAFESRTFGPYPWEDLGGIVDDVDGLGFALETQTRPIYSKDFFTTPENGAGVVVHELAHQWFGDSVAVARWQDIWLNEGFASYAEWLWSEHEGDGTAQETFDFFYHDFIPDDDPWWTITIGDPRPDLLFEYPVYFRGAMTLHVLRTTVGDDAFFRILKTWTRTHRNGNVRTADFIALAERISGQLLDDLFDTWLYTPGKPDLPTGLAARPAGPGGPAPLGVKLSLQIARAEQQHG